MKHIALLLAASLVIHTSSSFGASPLPARPAAQSPAKEQKARPLPFHGNIGSVDKQARTIKVGKRVFFVSAETKIIKNGRAATLADAVPGDEVGGSYRPGTIGALELVSLRIGPKVDSPK